MLKTNEDLESLIRRYILLSKPSPKGFEVVKCAKCNDYQFRGGFKFEGAKITYNCFNCNAKAKYDSNDRSISKAMREILLSFGIPDSEIQKCVSLSFFKGKKAEAISDPVKRRLELPIAETPLPAKSVLISTENSPWCEVAREYLKGRGLYPSVFPYYVSDDEKWTGRVIIPYFFKERIIYWQARSMDNSITPRYKNPKVEKDNIFFNMDELYRYTDDPLFVTEGSLDSLSIGRNAIALLGSTLSEFHEQELVKIASRRKIIFVIDKNLVGYKLGQKVLSRSDLQWFITVFPDNIDDSNEALITYGKLWLINHLTTTAINGIAGKTLLKLKCI